MNQVDDTHRTLAGLIHAVERESGKLATVAARFTSMITLSLGWVLIRSAGSVFTA